MVPPFWRTAGLLDAAGGYYSGGLSAAGIARRCEALSHIILALFRLPSRAKARSAAKHANLMHERASRCLCRTWESFPAVLAVFAGPVRFYSRSTCSRSIPRTRHPDYARTSSALCFRVTFFPIVSSVHPANSLNPVG